MWPWELGPVTELQPRAFCLTEVLRLALQMPSPCLKLGSQPWVFSPDAELNFSNPDQSFYGYLWAFPFTSLHLLDTACAVCDAHSPSPVFAASFPSFTATSPGLSTYSTSQLGRAMPLFLKSNGRRYSCMYMHWHHRNGDAGIFLSIIYHLILSSQNFHMINL